MNTVALRMLVLLSLGGAAGLPVAVQVASAQPAAIRGGNAMDEELRIALQGEDTARIRALLDGGADVNARDVIGATSLHMAVNFRGDIDVVRMVLDRGAQIDAVNDQGHTALLTALLHGHYRLEAAGRERLRLIVELLLARGASVAVVGRNGETPIKAAMELADIPLMQLLRRQGAALPDELLVHAISFDQPELVRFAMEAATPAMLARRGTSGATLLHLAAVKPRMLFVLSWLVGRGLDVDALDEDGTTPFGTAVLFGNLPAMDFFAGAKARLTMTSREGQTPLHLAGYGARHDVLRWVLDRGGDPRARDNAGRTALDIAIDTERFARYDDAVKLKLVEMLGGSRADIERGRFADHPLHDAVRQRDLAAVRRLLEAGTNANLRDQFGQTALYWAISLSSQLPATPKERDFGRSLLPLLIRHGADTTLRVKGGTSETHEDFARGLRLGDLLDRTKARHAPRAAKP